MLIKWVILFNSDIKKFKLHLLLKICYTVCELLKHRAPAPLVKSASSATKNESVMGRRFTEACVLAASCIRASARPGCMMLPFSWCHLGATCLPSTVCTKRTHPTAILQILEVCGKLSEPLVWFVYHGILFGIPFLNRWSSSKTQRKLPW